MLRGAILVNGIEIPGEAIVAEIQNHPAKSHDEAQKSAVRALVIRELLLQEAGRLNLTAQPQVDTQGRVETDEEALTRQLLDDAIRVPDARKAECLRYYEQHLDRFQSPARYEPRHILLAADRNDESAFMAALTKAQDLIKQLLTHPEKFQEFARQHSDCMSRESGGLLGEVTAGQTSKSFEKCLSKLQEGELHPYPVEADYGVHVLQLIRKTTGQTVPFQLVQDKIAGYLKEASWRQAVSQYITMLFGKAQVEGFTHQDLVGE